ncbi:MAG: site-specific DNA-methyltransferase [Campylobacterota bacterium]|nr:site-specific DNA-methyltransferase [Campylobacterota bacterium]
MDRGVELTSRDITGDKIEQLKTIFPEIVQDGKVDFDTLRVLLGDEVESDREAYKFEWVGKNECYKSIQTPSSATLNYSPDESLNPQHENLIIEGDNLEVLKLLQSSYKESIKMIYIDPPYNTGNDFVYPDNYTEPLANYMELTGQTQEGEATQAKKSKEGRKHTQWLNMMFPRLMLSRTLLKEDGVIFISIDDNEVDNLKKLCNEVFGEENFVETLIWKRRATPPNDRVIGKNHEYILVYSKNIEKLKLYLQPRSERLNNQYQNPDNDPKGAWKASDLSANGKGGRLSQNCIFPILNPHDNQEYNPPKNKCWLYNKEKIDELIENGRIGFRENSGRPFLKRYLSEVRDGATLATIIDNGGFSSDSSKELKAIFNNDYFDFPKPITLMQKILLCGTTKDDIILDFFAGSGTTGHATLALNAEDGGNRKFILVQLPEPTTNPDYPTIADITKERIRRVIEGYGDKPTPIESGFKVFKLSPSNYKINQKLSVDEHSDREALIAQLREQFRTSTDYEERFIEGYEPINIIYENILKEGYGLNSRIERVESVSSIELYRVSDGAKGFYITFDKVSSDIVKEREFVGASKDTLFICIDDLLSDDTKANLANSFLLKSM